MPQWLSRTLLVGLGAVFVLLPLHAFISTWGGTAVGPLWLWKSWKELLLCGLFVMAIVWLCLSPDRLRELFKKKYVLLLAAYVALTLVMAAVFVGQNGAEATAAGLAMNLRYILASVLVYILFRYSRVSQLWPRVLVWLVVGTGVAVSILGIIQVLLLPGDFFAQFGYDKATTIAPSVLIDDNPDLLRAFATLRGPNDFGAFLILPIVLVLAYAKRMPVWFGAGAMFFMCWALVLSSSRSAWIGAVVAILVYVALALGRRLSRTVIATSISTLVLVGVVGLYAAVNVPSLRMAIFHSSPGDPSLTEGSTDNHIAATVGGVQRVVEAPLGCGPGCAGPASYYGAEPQISENYFVQIAEEVGVVGLAVFVVLLWLIARELFRMTSNRLLARVLLAVLAGHIVVGLLLHVWSDDPLSMTWWMLVGALLGYNDGTTWKKSKDSSHSKTSSSS